jgi:hypothetical protein
MTYGEFRALAVGLARVQQALAQRPHPDAPDEEHIEHAEEREVCAAEVRAMIGAMRLQVGPMFKGEPARQAEAALYEAELALGQAEVR